MRLRPGVQEEDHLILLPALPLFHCGKNEHFCYSLAHHSALGLTALWC